MNTMRDIRPDLRERIEELEAVKAAIESQLTPLKAALEDENKRDWPNDVLRRLPDSAERET